MVLLMTAEVTMVVMTEVVVMALLGVAAVTMAVVMAMVTVQLLRAVIMRVVRRAIMVAMMKVAYTRGDILSSCALAHRPQEFGQAGTAVLNLQCGIGSSSGYTVWGIDRETSKQRELSTHTQGLWVGTHWHVHEATGLG